MNLSEEGKAWHLRGQNGDIEPLVDAIIRRVKPGEFDVVIIDPFYKCLGNRDENKAGDITNLLNHAERITFETGAAVFLAHHFPKGSSEAKQARDKTSGSGVWMRDPDLAINFTPQKKTDKNDPEPDYNRFTVEVVPRDYPDICSFVVEFKHSLFSVDEDGDPKAIRIKPGTKEKVTALDIAVMLSGDGMSHSEWLEKASQYGITKSTFNRKIKDVDLLGLAENDKGTWRRIEGAIDKAKSEAKEPTFKPKK